MRATTGILVVLMLAAPAARAQPSPCDCDCDCSEAGANGADHLERDAQGQWWRVRHVLDQDVRDALAAGVTFLALGYGAAAATAFTTHGDGHQYAIIPLVGPMISLGMGDQPAWATGTLLFSIWSQSVGMLLLATAGASWRYAIVHEPVQLGAVAAPGMAGLTATTHF